MSGIKKRICKEKDCGGELEFLVKIKDGSKNIVFYRCTKCSKVYSFR